MERSTYVLRAKRAVQEASELIVFADGFEDAGHPELARRSRLVARETLWLASAFADELRLRIEMQEQRDEARELFQGHE